MVGITVNLPQDLIAERSTKFNNPLLWLLSAARKKVTSENNMILGQRFTGEHLKKPTDLQTEADVLILLPTISTSVFSEIKLFL